MEGADLGNAYVDVPPCKSLLRAVYKAALGDHKLDGKGRVLKWDMEVI